MEKKLAVITGASRGLGQEIAVQFAETGYDLVLAARTECKATEERIKATGADVKYVSVACDTTKPESVANLKKKADEMGGCDILVNNVGIYPFMLFEDLDYDTWKNYFDVNVNSPYNCCQAFLPGMREKEWGRVINIASDAFHNGAEPKLSGYIATKGAVIGLTRALASEYGPYGVTVNAVAPGLFVTDQTVENIGGEPGKVPEDKFDKWDLMLGLQCIKKYPYPKEFVGAVKFLASEESGFMTGQTMIVDGGIARV